VPEITGGQSTLLGGRACSEVAFLRELKGNCVAPFYFQKIVYISGNSARVSVSSVTSVYLSGLRVGTLPSFFFFYKLHFYF
jgi:hypothetical protein